MQPVQPHLHPATLPYLVSPILHWPPDASSQSLALITSPSCLEGSLLPQG